jgi:hypothetical protein
MDTAGIESQVFVLATRLKGEVTWALFAGVVTVMAQAGAAKMKSVRRVERRVFMDTPRSIGPSARVQAYDV